MYGDDVLVDYLEDLNNNNFGFSWDSRDKWYVYGVKTNDKGFTIPGKDAGIYTMDIVKACKIQRLFIHDAAYVSCQFGVDKYALVSAVPSTEPAPRPTIDIDHFSIARILANKKGFYESDSVQYLEPEKARNAKQYLSSVFYNSLTKQQQTILKDFQRCARESCIEIPSDNCSLLNSIINDAITGLHKNGFTSSRSSNTVLSELIYTPTESQLGGKRKRKARKSARKSHKARKTARKEHKATRKSTRKSKASKATRKARSKSK